MNSFTGLDVNNLTVSYHDLSVSATLDGRERERERETETHCGELFSTSTDLEF